MLKYQGGVSHSVWRDEMEYMFSVVLKGMVISCLLTHVPDISLSCGNSVTRRNIVRRNSSIGDGALSYSRPVAH